MTSKRVALITDTNTHLGPDLARGGTTGVVNRLDAQVQQLAEAESGLLDSVWLGTKRSVVLPVGGL